MQWRMTAPPSDSSTFVTYTKIESHLITAAEFAAHPDAPSGQSIVRQIWILFFQNNFVANKIIYLIFFWSHFFANWPDARSGQVFIQANFHPATHAKTHSAECKKVVSKAFFLITVLSPIPHAWKLSLSSASREKLFH